MLGDGTEPEEGSSEVLWRHTVRGDAIMTVRPPGGCNLFTDPGCELERPNKQFSEDTLKVSWSPRMLSCRHLAVIGRAG